MVLSDMELHLLHLFPNLLNMYGDIGNLKTLEYRAKKRDITVFWHTVNVHEPLTFNGIDIVMLGDGQLSDFRLIVPYLNDYKKELSAYIENDGVFLAIGSGYQAFGNQIVALNGETLFGLDLLPINIESSAQKFVGDVAVSIIDETVVGFENHRGIIHINCQNSLGKVLAGFGNNGDDGSEGFRYKNYIGTNLHGPLLSKNPRFADMIIQTALRCRYNASTTLKELDDSLEFKAKDEICRRLNI